MFPQLRGHMRSGSASAEASQAAARPQNDEHRWAEVRASDSVNVTGASSPLSVNVATITYYVHPIDRTMVLTARSTATTNRQRRDR
jgi:hypothetical protein